MSKAAKRTFSTPMMKQYWEIKQQYKDSLLFFRLGDFYELFLDDAVVGAKALDIVLTKRPRGKDGHIPMAGVPFHSADSYIAKLVSAGHKVAICEQVSEPDGKGIVEREVVRVITPGTIMDDKALNHGEGNYTMSLSINKNSIGLAFADIGTGDFQTTQISFDKDFTNELLTEINRFQPKECILSPTLYQNLRLLKVLNNIRYLNMYPYQSAVKSSSHAEKIIQNHFNIKSLKTFAVDDKPLATKSSATLLKYLSDTQKRKVKHIHNIRSYEPGEYLILDYSTSANLELFSTIRDNKKTGSFINFVDNCITAMGSRMVKEWVKRPLVNKDQIDLRLETTEELLKNRAIRKKASVYLDNIYDLERIISRLSVNLGTPVDLVNLKSSLDNCSKILSLTLQDDKLRWIFEDINLNKIEKIILLIEKSIVDEPPLDPKNGGLIKSGVHRELDKLRNGIKGSKNWLEELEVKERQSTEIGSLKVRFNKVFGYYIEVSKTNLEKIPSHYERKQTLVNAERFITDELKQHEQMVLSSEEKINNLEYELFQTISDRVLDDSRLLQKLAKSIATLDVLINFANLAEENNYIKPKINSNDEIKITEGRHPVVEQMITDPFVPNNICLNNNTHQLLILTGPNMAGKSVYMRQVALITLMAHIGIFVPAKEAKISLTDRIFVRSGASDIITSGLSTFMVEMVETAHILNFATNKSLVILDEIGRGTSTYDGMSIAWAVSEYLLKNKKTKPKTIFATHYHELKELEKEFPNQVKNIHMSATLYNNELVFLHTIESGAASESYGVEVAKLAGLPKEVTEKSYQKLSELENNDNTILKKIKNINISTLTPLEALNQLSEIQKEINND